MTDFSILFDGFFDGFQFGGGRAISYGFPLLNYQQRLIHSFKAKALKLCISPESCNAYNVIGYGARCQTDQNAFQVSQDVFRTSRQFSRISTAAPASSSSPEGFPCVFSCILNLTPDILYPSSCYSFQLFLRQLLTFCVPG